jgi:hypothetical protein
MPQLDILLFFSQSFSGVVFVSGFLYFSKVIFPYLSFFVKFEEIKVLSFFEEINLLLADQTSLGDSRKQNTLVLKYIKSWFFFFERRIFLNSVLLKNR